MKTFSYPIEKVANSYRNGSGAFGANRPNGRKHAGCDLYAPPGTPVYAVKSGSVTAISTDFMAGNPASIGAVTVDHGIFLCRYAEIQPVVKNGQVVTAGQKIGEVQQLRFRSGFVTSMLHFELFSKLASGALSDKKRPPFMRRSDLVNPTFFLTLLECLVHAKLADK